MTVKSDRWIRQMAEEAQLIRPFEGRLVREFEGRRIISAGASSYGYDMRLADDGFRVFSPIHGREIDPKHFDESSLVEPPLRRIEILFAAASLLRPRGNGRDISHAAQRHWNLHGQEHLRSRRANRQHDATRSGLDRPLSH